MTLYEIPDPGAIIRRPLWFDQWSILKLLMDKALLQCQMERHMMRHLSRCRNAHIVIGNAHNPMHNAYDWNKCPQRLT